MSNVNVLAVIVAALSSFALGGLWYSTPVFGAAWRRAAGGPEIQGHPAKVFGLSILFALVAAFAYALIVPQPTSAVAAAAQGLLVGAAIVAASFGINYQFANRRTVLWLIDGGYHSVQFTIYGLILGLWR
jgi:uncharacterized protein DUF1761